MLLRQTRVGEHGELFLMYKFRTMRVDAEAPGVAVWATRDDPRVTSVGRIMRRFRLDELPQIWNVLIGDMSIVGPRPERPEFIDQLLESVPFWARRHLVKPGITGWAQVKRGYTADTKGSLEKLSYDLWYIRHRSLTTDAVICARTLAAILRGEPYPRAKKTARRLRPGARRWSITRRRRWSKPDQRLTHGSRLTSRTRPSGRASGPSTCPSRNTAQLSIESA